MHFRLLSILRTVGLPVKMSIFYFGYIMSAISIVSQLRYQVDSWMFKSRQLDIQAWSCLVSSRMNWLISKAESSESGGIKRQTEWILVLALSFTQWDLGQGFSSHWASVASMMKWGFIQQTCIECLHCSRCWT